MSDQRPGYWAVIPAEVLRDPVIPANAKLLFGDISTLTQANGYCYATTAYFAGLYGWSERTIYRLLKALEDQGHIVIETISGEERRIYCGRYLPRGTPDKIIRGQRQKCQGTPDNFVSPIKENIAIDNIPLKPPKGASVPKWKPDRFEAFWSYYRDHARGEDRAGASREWDRLKPDDGLIAVMGQALRHQTASEDWKRGIGIPYACRWLKNRRWEDVQPGGKRPAPENDSPTVVDDRRLQAW